MTFLELSAKTRQECGIQGQGPVAVTNQTGILKRVVEWVADADVLIQSMYSDWDFLWAEYTQNTIINSADLTKPDNFGMWDRESFAYKRGTSSGKSLNRIDFKEWRLNNSIKVSQEPSTITIVPSGDLKLGFPANVVAEVYANYWKNVVKMTINTNVPPYPDRFHRIIIARAKMWFFEDQEGWENFAAAEKEYLYWVNELEGFALPGQQDRSQAQPELTAARAE